MKVPEGNGGIVSNDEWRQEICYAHVMDTDFLMYLYLLRPIPSSGDSSLSACIPLGAYHLIGRVKIGLDTLEIKAMKLFELNWEDLTS